MQPSIKLDRTLVAVNVDGVVHLMLELAAPPAAPTTRAPLDVVLVLDRSGSMGIEPMHAVREATCSLLRLLGPHDRLGVVAFDNEIEMVLPLTSHDLDTACAAVRNIHSRGSTNLSGGWLKGLEMLSDNVRPHALRRIIVLTDGHANEGIVDSAQLCTMAAAAKEQGITTTTVGFDDGYDEVLLAAFDDGYDEVLLAAFADAGAGNNYWCAGPDQAPQVFAAEFEGLASVVAQNISVELRPVAGVEIAILNEYPITNVPGGMQVALGDAYGGERRRVVAMLTMPSADAVGAVSLGDIIVRWVSTIGDVSLHTVTIPVVINATDDPSADQTLNQEVIEQVNILRAAQAKKRAHDSLLNGDEFGARCALTESIALLSAVPGHSDELDQARADLLEFNNGQWSEASSKRLFSEVRGTQRGRVSRFDTNKPKPTNP